MALEATAASLRGSLFPEEMRTLGRAGVKRQEEFRAGRTLARRALDRLGYGGIGIPRDPDRVPVWPDGVVGSISHSKGHCAVAVARIDRVRSIGLDIEQAVELKAGLVPKICTAREVRWLERQPEEDRMRLAKLMFSAKESVYKAQYPITRRFLGFHDVELAIDQTAGLFAARILVTGEGVVSLPRIRGRFVFDDDLLLTGVGLLPTR